MMLFLKKRLEQRVKPRQNLLSIIKPAVAVKIQAQARGSLARKSLPFRRYLSKIRYT